MQVVMAVFSYVYLNSYVARGALTVGAVLDTVLRLGPTEQVRAGRGWLPAWLAGWLAGWLTGLAGEPHGLCFCNLVLGAGRRALWGWAYGECTGTVFRSGRGARCSCPLSKAKAPSRGPQRCASCLPLPPRFQMELLERLSNILVGQERLPQQLGEAIAEQARWAAGHGGG